MSQTEMHRTEGPEGHLVQTARYISALLALQGLSTLSVLQLPQTSFSTYTPSFPDGSLTEGPQTLPGHSEDTILISKPPTNTLSGLRSPIPTLL